MCVRGLVLGSEGLFSSNCSDLAQISDHQLRVQNYFLHSLDIVAHVGVGEKDTGEMSHIGHKVTHGHGCCSSLCLGARVES